MLKVFPFFLKVDMKHTLYCRSVVPNLGIRTPQKGPPKKNILWVTGHPVIKGKYNYNIHSVLQASKIPTKICREKKKLGTTTVSQSLLANFNIY